MFRLLHPRRLLLAGFAGVILCRTASASMQQQAVDLVVYGRVWTGDSTQPWAQAVAVEKDRVVAVGDSATISRRVGPRTRALGAGRGMVVPGFIDSHTHFIYGGFQLASVDLRDANTPAELVARIKRFAATLRPGEWITGGDWDHERWPDTPLPHRSWIDSVTPRNPVFVSRLDGHMGLANSAALRLARITRSTQDPPGGTIVRDRDGEPTGVLKDEAQTPVLAVIPTPSERQSDSAVSRALRWAASKGVTGVADVSVPWFELAALKRAHARGALTTRVSVYVPLSEWRRMADTVRANGVGDEWLRVAGVKGYVDGSLGSTTALFYGPYNDAPGTSGLMVTPEDSLRAWIGAADSARLQVVVHAIGERANGLLLQIFDSVAQTHGRRDRRFRIEHAQHLRRQDIDRIARTGVIASMQPYHAIDDGRWAEKRIGPERIKTTYAFRSLLDRGARLAFGSDWTVAPLDPLLGIYAAVTRRTLDGKHPGGWVPEERITVEEALRAYTTSNAYGVFAEKNRGKLAPGYLADFVVLDRDLTRVPPETIADAQVVTTVVGGKVVYSKK
ncbi:MAG TPA: amidohydrolase [Gemmatimonadales bacterium]|nr:amidohydrolase [Gemmatimonadales bacterium]